MNGQAKNVLGPGDAERRVPKAQVIAPGRPRHDDSGSQCQDDAKTRYETSLRVDEYINVVVSLLYENDKSGNKHN